jgi:ubiquinone/menaquinone biosynthesis C-methylase UbiE
MPSQNLQAQPHAPKATKPYKGMAMEGRVARWYTSIRQRDPEIDLVVRQVRDRLPGGGHMLEVAPGPGYLAIELARSGAYQVTGLDISASFVQIASAKAAEAGVAVSFQQGDAAHMPFGDDLFDIIVCRAAFKNFSEPVQAMQEMHRVLRSGGAALISDLRSDASPADIQAEIATMHLNAVNRFMTGLTFRYFLLKNAYTGAAMRQMANQTPFARCDIDENTIGMHVWLTKSGAA